MDTSIQTLLQFSCQTSEAAAFLISSGQVQLGSLILSSHRILGLKGESDDQTSGSLQREKYWGQGGGGEVSPSLQQERKPSKGIS